MSIGERPRVSGFHTESQGNSECRESARRKELPLSVEGPEGARIYKVYYRTAIFFIVVSIALFRSRTLASDTVPRRPPSHAAVRTATKSGTSRAACAMLLPTSEPASTTAMLFDRTS